MGSVEVTREDTRSGPVFVATPATPPPIRIRALLIAGVFAVLLIIGAGFAPDSVAGMLRWLAALCTVPVLVLWAVMLTETVRRRGVRLAVTPVGLTVNGRAVIPHDAIRDLALYPMVGRKPLFVAKVAHDEIYGHKAELALAGGEVPVGGETMGHNPRHRVRLVMRRRNHLPPLVLVRGLTVSGGETLLAALAAELRPYGK